MYSCSNDVVRYKCKKCPDFQTECLSYLREHVASDHGPPTQTEMLYKCLVCRFETYAKYLIIRHSMFDKCTSKNPPEIKSEATSSEAQDVTASTSNSEKIEWFECKKCPCKFKYITHLGDHLARLHDSNSVEYEGPKKMLYECRKCPDKFNNKDFFEKHMLLQHSASKFTESYQCPQCLNIYKSRSMLSRHFCSKQEPKPKSRLSLVEEEASSSDQYRQCEYCSLLFKRYNLKKHINNTHINPKNFTCDTCGARCQNDTLLKKHMLLKHSQGVHLHCDVCLEPFNDAIALRKHKRAEHKEIQWLQCDKCPSKFKNKEFFEKHVALQHSAPKDAQYEKCEKCSKIFINAQVLAEHIKAKHSKNQ